MMTIIRATDNYWALPMYMHCSKHLIFYAYLFMPKNPVRLILLFPFYRWKTPAGSWMQGCLATKLCHGDLNPGLSNSTGHPNKRNAICNLCIKLFIKPVTPHLLKGSWILKEKTLHRSRRKFIMYHILFTA